MDALVCIILLCEAFLAYVLLDAQGCLKSKASRLCSVFLILIAFSLRACVFDYETLDYLDFLTKWVSFFRNNGHFAALRHSVGNYNIPYLYFLALFSLSGTKDLYLIKLLSTFFDIILAWASMKLLSRSTHRVSALIGCFFTVLLLPTVFLNSAVWGQCDSTYAAMLLLAMYLAFDDRPVLSILALTVAFGFKLQAVFVMPVFAVFWMRGKFKWFHFLLFPVFYALLVLPAVLLGRPFFDTITLYFSQTGSIGNSLNYNSSSLFAILDHVSDPESASVAAIASAFLFVIAVLLLCYIYRDRLNDRITLGVAVLFAIGIPFLLPHMHDRYFFCADVLTVVLAFVSWPSFPAAVLTQFASLLGYHAYLKMRFLLPMRYGAFALLTSLVLTILFCFFPSDGAETSGPALNRKRSP